VKISIEVFVMHWCIICWLGVVTVYNICVSECECECECVGACFDWTVGSLHGKINFIYCMYVFRSQ
jgi:hypothetical protein